MQVKRDQLIADIQKIYPFNLASWDEIELMVDASEIIFFEAEKLIFQQNAEAGFVYLIIEGKVEILKEEKQQLNRINRLRAFTLFGEDAVSVNHIRRSSARAVENCILVKLSVVVINKLTSHNKAIHQAFNLLITTYENLITQPKLLVSNEEMVYYAAHPHSFFFFLKSTTSLLLFSISSALGIFLYLRNFFSLSFFVIFLILITGLFILFITWRYLEWRNDLFIFTHKRIIKLDRMMLLHEIRVEIPLNALISINIRKIILGRHLGFGDMFIKTFTGAHRLKYVAHVDSVAAYLDFLWKQEKMDARLEVQRAIETAVSSSPETRDDSLMEPTKPQSESARQNQGSVSGWLNRLLRLRVQEDDRIIYRTHWAIMLRKTLVPALLIIGFVMLNIYLWVNHMTVINSRAYQTFSIVFIVICLLVWLYQYIDWRCDQYIITSDQIIDVDRKPLGAENLRAAPIKNIQSIRYQRSGLLRLALNFGTVYIRVGDDELTFDQVYNPAAVQQELFYALESVLSQQKQAEMTEQQRRMIDWIASRLHSTGQQK